MTHSCHNSYGVVLRELGDIDAAKAALAQSVCGFPLNWSAWADLAALCVTRDAVDALPPLPSHWMLQFFLAHTYLELQVGGRVGGWVGGWVTCWCAVHAPVLPPLPISSVFREWMRVGTRGHCLRHSAGLWVGVAQVNHEALRIYSQLSAQFPNSPYIIAQLARTQYSMLGAND